MRPNFRSVPDPCLRCAENRGREFCLGRVFLRDAESGDFERGYSTSRNMVLIGLGFPLFSLFTFLTTFQHVTFDFDHTGRERDTLEEGFL